MNLVRKHKGVMLPYGLLGENGRQWTNCGRVVEEWSSLLWKRSTISSKKTTKGSKKVWEVFIQWLRIKCIVTVKDFQKDCEWKCFF